MRVQKLDGWEPGSRVELHPATDAWMAGDRFGCIVRCGRRLVHVKMDRSGRTLKVAPRHIYQHVGMADGAYAADGSFQPSF
jgi:hypothetical protein